MTRCWLKAQALEPDDLGSLSGFPSLDHVTRLLCAAHPSCVKWTNKSPSFREFPGGSAEPSIVTAVAQVAAVVWVRSLAWELLHAMVWPKKKKKKKVIAS